ncbi:MAG: protein kinase domain-containing protein [Micromonosporaceae bacterium]
MTRQADTVLGGRYRLGEPIGRGGMGTVWRALDTVLGREVAVKVLVLQLDDGPDTRARFRREARVLARLSHPRLGGIHDYGEEHGRAFTVMEYITGETLQNRLARLGCLPAPEAAEIAAQVAEGLHAAHKVGVIHRDVKPANIILGEQGVKLVDFGIALGAEDDRLTATGTLIGSATYVAPERGTGGPATPASDIYSLGVVLYQMLAGTPPFTGSDPVKLVAAHAGDPVPPLPPDVPDGLAHCCVRALAKDPVRRPPSALAFASMLREPGNPGYQTLVIQPGRASETGPPTRTFPQVQTFQRGTPGLRNPRGPRAPLGRQHPQRRHSPRSPQALRRSAQWPRRRRFWVPAATGIAAAAVVAGIAVLYGTAGSHSGATGRTGTGQAGGSHGAAKPAGPSTTWAVAIGAPQDPGHAPPPVLAPAGATVRLAEILSNPAGQPVHDAMLTVSAPPGWTVTPKAPPVIRSIRAGGEAIVNWSISVPASARPGGFDLAATARCAASGPCGTTVKGTALVPFPSFSKAFNNTGIAPHATTGLADMDGTGLSYQAEALAAAGFSPGAQVRFGGISFAWPNRQPGETDNVATQAQTFLISGTGTRLAFLGAADFGSAGGDGTIYYRDGSRQQFHLVMDDWWKDQATPGQDEVALTTPHPNNAPGQPPRTGPPVAIYFSSFPLQAGKTVAAVTLPQGSAPAQDVPCLHLFAAAIG